MVGVWPLDPAERGDLVPRIQDYAVKAARESKVHTSWLAQRRPYERALRGWVRAVLGSTRGSGPTSSRSSSASPRPARELARRAGAARDGAGRSRRVPGHRAVVVLAGRPRQPPPGRLRAPRASCSSKSNASNGTAAVGPWRRTSPPRGATAASSSTCCGRCCSSGATARAVRRGRVRAARGHRPPPGERRRVRPPERPRVGGHRWSRA